MAAGLIPATEATGGGVPVAVEVPDAVIEPGLWDMCDM